MNERDRKILKHIGLYRLSIRAVIEHLFFDGRSSDDVLRRLVSAGKIKRVENAFPGGLSYYQIGLQEARTGSAPVPPNRALNQGARSIRHAMAVLWFSCMTDKKRRKLDNDQLTKLYGKLVVRPHVAELSPQGRHIIYSLHAPGANSRDDYLPKRLARDQGLLSSHPVLSEWVRSKKIGFSVLVETPKRKERLARLLHAHNALEVPVHLELVPGISTLHSAIQEFQKKHPPTWYDAARSTLPNG